MKIDIKRLDSDIRFLTDQAITLRRTQQGADCAVKRAQRFDEIAETLRQVRQDQQMTTMSGGKIT